jgi:hypothetical protein
MVKEVQSVQAMMDIPKMKRERDSLREELKAIEQTLMGANEFLNNKPQTESVIFALSGLPLYMADTDICNSAIQLRDVLQTRLNESGDKLKIMQQQKTNIETQIEQLTKRIQKAR